ncbi:MAG: hypothetical protein L0154_09405 [Chloroflexi bacterium]|nr:hypothetical protein [Chloroflexota bacterium]
MLMVAVCMGGEGIDGAENKVNIIDNYPLNAITLAFLDILREECPQLETLV